MDYPRSILWRSVPLRSQPFFYASLLQTIGGSLFVGVVMTFGGVLGRRMGAGPTHFFFLSMAPFIGFLLSTPIVRLAFRFRWGPILGIILIAANAILLCFVGIGKATPFIILLVITGALRGSTQVLDNALLKSHVRETVRPSIIKWLQVIGMLFIVPVSYATGFFLDRDQSAYRWLWPVVGVLGILSVLPLFRLPVRNTERQSLDRHCARLEELTVLKEDKRFLVFLLVFFIGTFAEKVGMPIQPIYFADILDLRYADIGNAIGVYGPLLGVAGFFFWGWLLRRISPLLVLTICMFLKSTRPICWALAVDSGDPMLLVVIGEAVFRFMLSGVALAAILTVLQMSDESRIPVYVGLHFWFMGVRGVLGPILGWRLYESGFPIIHIYWLITAIVLCGGVALAAFMWGVRKRP